MFLEMGICILGPGVQSGPAASTWQLTVPPLMSPQWERRSRSQTSTFPWPSCWHSAAGVHCPLLWYLHCSPVMNPCRYIIDVSLSICSKCCYIGVTARCGTLWTLSSCAVLISSDKCSDGGGCAQHQHADSHPQSHFYRPLDTRTAH